MVGPLIFSLALLVFIIRLSYRVFHLEETVNRLIKIEELRSANAAASNPYEMR
jgi:hypothetical protein